LSITNATSTTSSISCLEEREDYMKLAAIMLAILLMGSSIQCFGVSGTPSGGPDSQADAQRSDEAVIRYLHSTLVPVGKAARIYFHGTCGSAGDNGVLFPAIEVQPPADGDTGLEAVRQIFRNDKNVAVTESPSGIVRISIGNVYTSILNTRLPFLRLSETSQYNPDGPGGAIDALEEAAAVKSAMRELGVRQEPIFYIGLKEPALKTLPHLQPWIKNATMDQALDSIAETFPGVVVYGECSGPGGVHLVDISFDWFHADH
jgi:hypothetical protein